MSESLNKITGDNLSNLSPDTRGTFYREPFGQCPAGVAVEDGQGGLKWDYSKRPATPMVITAVQARALIIYSGDQEDAHRYYFIPVDPVLPPAEHDFYTTPMHPDSVETLARLLVRYHNHVHAGRSASVFGKSLDMALCHDLFTTLYVFSGQYGRLREINEHFAK